ncbi:dipeptidase, partial [Amycolatopsis magusensis]|nr:dipeptidase [Amycolatopsis magusensis]
LHDRRADPAYAFAHLRSSFLDQLLLPEGLRLLVVEGFRPPPLQQRHFEGYGARAARRHTGCSAEEQQAQQAG